MVRISEDLLKKFYTEYNTPHNKFLENVLTNNGILAVALNKDAVNKAKDIFSLELKGQKILDQKESQRCWAFAGINMCKGTIADNLDIDPTKFELSVNYISFWDKLEKINSTYENIIKLIDKDIAYRELEYIVQNPIPEGGDWSFFAALVKKYGLVPLELMPESYNSVNSEILIKLLSEKVKKDIIILKDISIKHPLEKLREVVHKMLYDVYTILCKTLGQPPGVFDFEYRNRQGKYVKLTNLTPIDFKNKYMTKDLDEYISVGHVPNKEYGRLYKIKYFSSVEGSNIQYLNLPIDRLKHFTILQLQNGEPVFFICEIRKMRDKKKGILDAELYNFEDILGIKKLTKEESLKYKDIARDHAMVFTGVNIEDEIPNRWKVEDSRGLVHKDGYYVMNDNFFDEFVLQVIINKKYLSIHETQLLKQEPILYDMWEPMG